LKDIGISFAGSLHPNQPNETKVKPQSTM